MPNPNNDTIQLLEDGVQHRLPSYADEEDMYAALERCGLTQRQIFDELDRRYSTAQMLAMSELELADGIRAILFDAFDEALADVTAHKVPLYG